MHMTDVRLAIVRGIRTLLLVLLSWILAGAALIVDGFLVTLIFTGLYHLWQTRFAATLLLGSDALLVVLINAAFQSGVAADVAPRVGDYGWTSERVIAAACLLVASCYAAGYAWAACRPGAWLAAIAKVNRATAFVILALLLALFTPLADPA